MSNRTITIPARTATLAITALEERPADRIVNVTIAAVDETGLPVSEYGTRTIQIDGTAYDMLVDDNEGNELLPGKPPGTYRNQDLWYFIEVLGGLC
jgi:hypothetical protein